MQELVYSNYVLERMDFNEELGTHRRREGKYIFICVICAVRTVKVWVTFCVSAQFIQCAVHYF